MSDLDDLLARLPISDIASQLGVDDATARSASAQALPALLAGLQQQTGDEDSAQKLAGALSQHGGGLADGEISLGDVDTADGQKIVANIFGGETDNVASALSGANQAAGVNSGLVAKLLPILAPIVLSFITSKLAGGAKAGGAASGGGADLGSILGSALGGNAAGGIGDLLGGLLGGAGAGGQSGGGIGDLLGGILGGKK